MLDQASRQTLRERLCPLDDERIFQNLEVPYGGLPGHLRGLGDFAEIETAARPFRDDPQNTRETFEVSYQTFCLDLLFQIVPAYERSVFSRAARSGSVSTPGNVPVPSA